MRDRQTGAHVTRWKSTSKQTGGHVTRWKSTRQTNRLTITSHSGNIGLQNKQTGTQVSRWKYTRQTNWRTGHTLEVYKTNTPAAISNAGNLQGKQTGRHVTRCKSTRQQTGRQSFHTVEIYKANKLADNHFKRCKSITQYDRWTIISHSGNIQDKQTSAHVTRCKSTRPTNRRTCHTLEKDKTQKKGADVTHWK